MGAVGDEVVGNREKKEKTYFHRNTGEHSVLKCNLLKFNAIALHTKKIKYIKNRI